MDNLRVRVTYGCGCCAPDVWTLEMREEGVVGWIGDVLDPHMGYIAEPVADLWDLLGCLAFCALSGDEVCVTIEPV